MTRIRRGGFVFLMWIGDHGPRHVHIYEDGRLIGRWDLDRWQAIDGRIGRRVQRLLAELESEGRLCR